MKTRKHTLEALQSSAKRSALEPPQLKYLNVPPPCRSAATYHTLYEQHSTRIARYEITRGAYNLTITPRAQNSVAASRASAGWSSLLYATTAHV